MLALTTGCAHIVQIEKACGSGQNELVCTGAMSVPREKREAFEQGAKLAIDAVASPKFEEQLTAYIVAHAADADIAASWKGHTANKIVADVRAQLPGVEVVTFGGVKGAWFGVVFGTVAFEGNGGPIPMNRWGMSGRRAADIANTIIHEAAHAAGLTHPSSDTNLATAKCEPPYVIGSIAQRVAEGSEWKWSPDDCDRLRPAPATP